MEIRFFVPGQPVAQSRHRFDPRTKRTYQKPEIADFRSRVAFFANWYMRENKISMIEAGIPITMEIVVKRPIPASWSKKKQELAIAGQIKPTSKPDNSNYLKGIEDALNMICYKDDSAITRSVIEKIYSKTVGVEISIFAEYGGVKDEK